MERRNVELLAAWSGVPFVVLFFVGFLLIAHWVPPLSPAWSANRLATHYDKHRTAIRVGMTLAFIGCMFFMAFGAAVATQTRRIRGIATSMCYLQLMSVAASVIILILPIMLWWVAAFRADRSPELVQLLNDVASLVFVVGFVPYITWAVSVGVAILSDRSSGPLYPRWAGWLSIVAGGLQVQGFMLAFRHEGPFAWDGLFSWWIPLCVFFGWMIVIMVLTIQAVGRTVSADKPDCDLERAR